MLDELEDGTESVENGVGADGMEHIESRFNRCPEDVRMRHRIGYSELLKTIGYP
jgi:hypothetical protein